MWGNVTVKKLQAPCFHVLGKGVLKSTALTATLLAISTSASISTNFTGTRSTITSDGSGRRSAPLWNKKYQRHKTSSASTANNSNSGSAVGLRNRWRTSFSSSFLLVKRLGARWPHLMLQDQYGRLLTNACLTKRSGSQLSRLQTIFLDWRP